MLLNYKINNYKYINKEIELNLKLIYFLYVEKKIVEKQVF